MLGRMVVAAMLVASPVLAADYDRSTHFVTKDSSLACGSPADMQEGAAALKSGDQAWLRKTNCLIVPGGVPAVLIQAAWNQYSPRLWYVHLRLAESAGQNVYISDDNILTWYDGGIFKSAKEADTRFNAIRAIAKDRRSLEVKDHELLPEQGGFHLLFGPNTYRGLYFFCFAVYDRKMRCEPTVGLPG